MTSFENYVQNLKQKLQKIAKIHSEKQINYGRQLIYIRNEERSIISLYYNKKGQFHIVWPLNKNRLTMDLMKEAEINSTFTPKVPAKNSLSKTSFEEREDEWKIWAGSDESGKGDFFGPLIVAAVAVNREIGAILQNIGVKDCKELTDKKILELEPLIKKQVLDWHIIEMMPKEYNYQYSQIKNLNILNANCHIQVLQQILTNVPNVQGALIDQFLTSTFILKDLKKQFPKKEFLQRPRAEDNPAVAAASVLARAQFLHDMQKLALQAGIKELPKGSGSRQVETARKIALKFGKEILYKFVKTHFSSYQQI